VALFFSENRRLFTVNKVMQRSGGGRGGGCEGAAGGHQAFARKAVR
jgi:hypothetical protein